jgi:hypothetical protein
MVGRASFSATEEQRRTVRAMAGYGIPQDEIARVVINPATGRPITRKTLARHFGDEIATGATQANISCRSSGLMRCSIGSIERKTITVWWLITMIMPPFIALLRTSCRMRRKFRCP